jgi:hypothetical protein
MNKDQFIFWLKGFTKAVNEKGPTPKQWETIVSELDKIKDCPDYGSPIGEGGWGVPNLAPIQTIPFIQPYPSDPYNPYKIHYGTTGESGVILTTTSGSNGTITYNPSTTTLWNPSGSNWSYTSTLPQQQPTTGSNQLELDLK